MISFFIAAVGIMYIVHLNNNIDRHSKRIIRQRWIARRKKWFSKGDK